MIHVAAGVVENARGEILIAKRPDHLHQGGLWEFPGGKIEPGEDVFIALRRELKEEVNLAIQQTQPLIQIPWHYPDKSVLLDVLRIVDYDGEARGLEGQTIQWVRKTDLANYTFPAANQGIVNALMLPDSYMITGAFNEVAEFKTRLESQLQQGIRLVQLRARHIDESELDVYIKIAKELCETYHARLLLNANIKKAREFGIGVHLTSQQLMESKVRPFDKHALVAASVHNEQELQQANQLGVDFVLISPVQKTSSHPDASPLGWDRFSQLTAQASVPVYALGGMSVDDIPVAKMNGAQGIAAISCFWN